MLNPRHVCQPIMWAMLLICAALFLIDSTVLAQAPSTTDAALSDKARGIELYQQGNDLEAVAVLQRAVKQDQDDLRAWHYLGLALGRQGKLDEARKAHEKAAKLGESLMLKHSEEEASGAMLERLREIIALLNEAIDSADQYFALGAPRPQNDAERLGYDKVTSPERADSSEKQTSEWRERAEFLRYFSWLAAHTDEGNPDRIFAYAEVTTKARILSKPEPQFTEEARQNQIIGTVVLRAVLAADGKVRAIRPLATLPYGLTMAAIRVARSIKFSPAILNGKPVSQYIQIEYNFNL